MNILFVSASVPSPQDTRPFGFLTALAARGHIITLVCLATPADATALATMRACCHKVVAIAQSRGARTRNILRAAFGSLPHAAAGAFAPQLLDAIRAEVRSGQHQVAHVDGLPASALGYGLIGLPAVLDAADCASLNLAAALRAGGRASALFDLARTRRHEAAYQARYERVFAASAEDAWALRTLAQDVGTRCAPVSAAQSRTTGGPTSFPQLHVVPTGIDLPQSGNSLALRHQSSLLVLAGRSDNAASLGTIVRRMMPRIWQQRADVQLLIAGQPPASMRSMIAADARITLLETEEATEAQLSRATLVIVPTGPEAATRAIAAMSRGTAVVADRAVGRKLFAANGHELLLADGPLEYANSVLALLDDPGYRGQLGNAGRSYVAAQHTLSLAAAGLEQVYAAACGATIADWRLDLGLHRPFERELGSPASTSG